MPLKRIAFIIMCAMLLLTVILAVVVAVKVAPFLGVLLGSTNGTVPSDPTVTTTDPTIPTTTQPTVPPTVPPTTPPTQPATKPHEHTFSTVKETVKATCDTAGHTIYVCQCGEEKLETVEPTGHIYGAGKLVKPTCETEGYTLRVCSVCKHEDKQDVQEALGHDWEFIKEIEVSCESHGYKEYKCKRTGCGEIDHDEIVEATGHNWVKAETVEPTCTEQGYTKYTCPNKNCEQKEKTDDVLPALGHSFGDWIIQVEPSAGIAGEEQRVCETCGEEEKRDLVLDILIDKGIYSTQDGEQNLWIINVGTKDGSGKEVTVYSYEITDRSGWISVDSFAFDPETGLLITFQDKSGTDKSYAMTSDAKPLIIDKDGNQETSSGQTPPEESTPATEATGSAQTPPAAGEVV